ncbi:MAG TPA: hypothetical protein VE985_00760 [Gaiellaceae bacterium]|nr:hypothetical protein [Gaiellaceae bacterium]
MALFRRNKETLNEQLLREAGLDPAQVLGDQQPLPPVPEPTPSVLATVGVPDGSRVPPKEWDTTAAVRAPGLAGDRAVFTTLPNGDLIVDEDAGDGDLSPLADAVERNVTPPYRAVATRQDGDLWAVGARRIMVARIPFPEGEKLELARRQGEHSELRVDGEPSNAPAPLELERLGEGAGEDFYAEAERIDGDLWEVKVTAL